MITEVEWTGEEAEERRVTGGGGRQCGDNPGEYAEN